MKSLTLLWREVANELAAWCCTSTTLDFKTVESRVKHEGLSFLTITLPTFGKDFEKSLDQGKVDRCLFQGFSWKGGLPQFLGGFLDRVFDRGTGRLVDEPCIDSIFAIRQLTLMFGKMLLPCSDARVAAAMKGYIDCEQEVRRADKRTTSEDCEAFRRMSALLFRDVFTKVDSDIYNGDILPKHGPGSTAERISGNSKYSQSVWPDRLESIFNFVDYALPNPRHHRLLDRVDFLEPGSETPVRVISVPKTLSTPRIIAIEPVAMQYMQQGLMEKFVDYLEQDHLVRDMIGFTHQVPNQDLARKGSHSGDLATLDLSEASDRVSNQHVREMLHNWTWLNQAVDATRSRKADVPGFGVIRLAKYASMGSALCFPMEAMVFLTIIFLGLQAEHKRQFTRKDVQSFAGRVRVYGDDLVIPVDHVRSVVEALETFGFQVNQGKSFWNGKFRESCGKEYYDSHDVSIVRCRRSFPTQRSDVLEIISFINLRNRLYEHGLWMTAKWMDERIREDLRKVIKAYPTVLPTSPALGRISHLSLVDSEVKWDPKLHIPLVRGLVVSAIKPRDWLNGEFALLKWFLKRGDEPFADRDHLERHGRPDAVDIKLRWVSPF